MIVFGQRSEPHEITLPYGLSVAVKPLATLAWPQRKPPPGAWWRRSSGRLGSARKLD